MRPITELKRRTSALIAEVRRRRRPVLITDRDRPAAVLLDVETYESLLERLDLFEGLARGERAVSHGRTVSHAQASKHLARRWIASSR